MRAKKKQLVYFPSEKKFIIGKVKYAVKKETYKKIDGVMHVDKVIFEEVSDVDHKAKVDFIKSKLRGSISKEDVLNELIKGIDMSSLNKICKLLQDKKTKVKKQRGCLGLKIDGGKRNSIYIPIFD